MELGYRTGQGTKAKNSEIIVPSLNFEDDKWCPTCKQYKLIKEFYSDAGREGGIAYTCKECDNKRRMGRYRRAKELKKRIT